MRRVRKLVGSIRAEQLRSVDWALGRDVGVFIPMAGPCGYAITHGHSHPAWSFIVPFDDLCRVRIDGRVLRSRPDQVCAIGPGVPHEELPGSETARYAAVFVAPGLMRRALRHHGLEQLPPARGQLFAGTPEILGAIREIMLEQSARLPGAAPLIDAAAVRLVHHILRALLHAGRRPERIPARASIRRAAALADGSTGDPLTVSDLARAAPVILHAARRTPTLLGCPSTSHKVACRLSFPISEHRTGQTGTSCRSKTTEEMSHNVMATGTVKWFNDAKGFGFITQDGGGEDVFCHHTAIKADGFRTLAEGQKVEFDVTKGPKGLQAANARPL